MFMQAIRDARILEIDLPPRLERTPFAIPYFQMSEVAIEAFYIVAQEPGMRSHWVALAKVCASGDGEYAGPYLDCEKAAKARFPEVFFRACPDWNELVLSASRASAERAGEYDGAR